jgi:hypothetical protein
MLILLATYLFIRVDIQKSETAHSLRPMTIYQFIQATGLIRCIIVPKLTQGLVPPPAVDHLPQHRASPCCGRMGWWLSAR